MAQTPLPLDRIDPADAWQPWEANSGQPWNLQWAGHLFRRAGFGASLAELRQAVHDGFTSTVERVLAGAPDADERQRLLLSLGESLATGDDIGRLRGWWVYCMLYTQHPLHEKMTLFWHNHFATSVAKVGQPRLMFQQNARLRQHALGRFRPFLLAISRDPAMLLWLDSNSNVKGKANENYARELMELFSLGVGHYSETDVREAARSFTGWRAVDEGVEIAADLHDDGVKTVLGQRGNWNGDDVVRIVLEQPAAARFLVRKIYRWLVSEAQEPPERLLQPLAEAFRQSDYDIAALVRTVLRSQHFFSAHAYRQRVKSPVEFALGAVRAFTEASVDMQPLANYVEAMGQSLFAPPNVKGWVGGKSWLNTATVLARHEFAQALLDGHLNTGIAGLLMARPLASAPGPWTPLPSLMALLQQEKATKPEAIVTVLLDLLLQGDVSADARAKLIAFLDNGKPKGKDLDQRIGETARSILTMPEYQLA